MKMHSIIPRLLIISVAALVGASIGKVAGFDQGYSAAGGGIIATIAVGIGALFDTKSKELEKTAQPSKLPGLRIGVVGCCVAVGGLVVAVYASQSVVLCLQQLVLE